MKKNFPKIIFITLIIIFCLAYIALIQSKGGTLYIESRSAMSELGEFFGSLGYIFLILVYARTILKLIVAKNSFWQRLKPFETAYLDIKGMLGKLLYILNRTHAYLGTLAIASIFLHCYLTSNLLENFLLRLVLLLLAWQGIFGAFMQFKYTSYTLKRKSYLLHAQLFTGIIILILALFGHLLIND